MKPIHIIGQPGSGKTVLIVDIIQELNQRSICVGSIKHSSHIHELDTPGKDSFLHRKAGASMVSMITREMTAVYLPHTVTPQDLLEKYYSHLDIVLIEGWISGPYNKIEVWRSSVEKAPLFSTGITHVKAIVTDDVLDPESARKAGTGKVRGFKRKEVAQLVDMILKLT